MDQVRRSCREGWEDGVAIIRRGKKWTAVIYLGQGRQKWRTFPTRREAELYEARAKLDGAPLAPRRYSVEEYLREWLAARPQDTATAATYEDVVTLHLVPAIGAIPLSRLGPAAIEDMMTRERVRGAALSSIARQLAVLSSALKRAVKRGLIRQNPVAPGRPTENPAQCDRVSGHGGGAPVPSGACPVSARGGDRLYP
jgi:integrase